MNVERAELVHKLILEPSELSFCDHAIDNFYWPVSRKKVANGARQLMLTYVSFVNKLGGTESSEARLISIISSYLISDLVSLLQAQLVINQANSDNADICLPNVASYFHLAANIPVQKLTRGIGILQNGIPKKNIVKRWMRPLRDITHPIPYIRRPASLIDFKNDTVCLTDSPLTRRKVESFTRKPVIADLSEWFFPLSDAELRIGEKNSLGEETLEDFLRVLFDVFSALGGEPSNTLKRWLKGHVLEMCALISAYRFRLLQQEKNIPLKLYSGSSGIIWCRLLAEAVQLKGGHVTTFDHAQGANFAENTHMPFIEFAFSDEFVTFNKTFADLFRRAGKELCLMGKPPMVSSISLEPSAESLVRKDHAERRKGILYVSPFIPLDQFGINPLYVAPVILDWQAYLQELLLATGAKVTRKPHPGSVIKTPVELRQASAVDERQEPFEFVFEEYECVVFDFTLQTSFGTALRSNVPVLLINTGHSTWTSAQHQDLEHRVAILDVQFDEKGRIRLDAAELPEAIKLAKERSGNPAPNWFI